MAFFGSFVALITPFHPKGGVDRRCLEELVEWHVGEGTDGIVCCGTTGEGVALSDHEKKRVAEICVKTAAKRIAVIVGTGTSDTRQSVRLTEMAQKVGADGCLVVTPYYNKPSQEGCLVHFREVAQVGLPVIAYHNPGRAAVRLSLETVLEMSEIHGIVGMKDSSHDLEFIRNIRKHSALPIFAGDDDMTCSILREGGVGAISVIGNLLPRGWKWMIQLCLQKKWEAAERLAQFYMPLCRSLFLETNPQCVKWAMHCLGFGNGVLRLPLLEPDLEVQKILRQDLIRIAMPFFSEKKIPV